MISFTKDNLPKLRKLYDKHYKLGLEYDNDWNVGSDYREAQRLEKVIRFLELEYDLKIEHGGSGLILINKKFIVSLASNKWKVKGKNVWYRHKNNLKDFVKKYILDKEKKNDQYDLRETQ